MVEICLDSQKSEWRTGESSIVLLQQNNFPNWDQ